MKTYIMINGKTVVTFNANDMNEAVTIAENIADHSNEVIIREYTTIYASGYSLKAMV